jgi:hypothetical protein
VTVHRRVGSVFWMAIGVYTAIQGYRLGLGRLSHPDRGFVFFLAALVLIIFGAIDLAGTFVKKPKLAKGAGENPLWRGFQWQRVLLVLGGLSAYTYFLNLGGFWLCTFLLMVFLFKGVESTKWWIAIASSLITTLLSFAVFKVWLGVEFPKGFLGY